METSNCVLFGNSIRDLPWPKLLNWSSCKYASHYQREFGCYYFCVNMDILFQENFSHGIIITLGEAPVFGQYGLITDPDVFMEKI